MRPLSGPRRRGALGVLAGVAAALIMAAVAAADAVVRTAGAGRDTLVVEVTGTGNHAVIVEPFERSSETVTRVRQQALGNPSIRSNDSVCDHNPVFNDVVCRVPAERVEVTMGNGNDRVEIREAGQGDESCVEIPRFWTVEVTLGSGADVLTAGLAPANACTSGQFSTLHRRASITANGGAGADELNATSRGSTLEGGSGSDRLLGTNRGNDTLRGGSGPDLLSGGTSATAGDFDTATYSEVGSTAMSLTLDERPNDGVAGEGDNISFVERVIGGGGPDSIIGNDRANTLVGSLGSDSINGQGGDDVLDGGPGSDELSGVAGTDRFIGDADNDFIQARDGVAEIISCGSGFSDSAIGDLADFFNDAAGVVRNKNGLDCEVIDAFAIDDGPPASAVGRSLKIASGAAPVIVACPRNARIACRGTLTARLGGIRGRVVGRVRYSAQLGKQTTVSLRVGNRSPGTRIVLETVEPGVSKKGPRSATRLVVVR